MRKLLALLVALVPAATAFSSLNTSPTFSAHNKNPISARPAIIVSKRASAAHIVSNEASRPQQQATLAAAILGLASQPVMWWSLYTLKTTGCGLPGGPFGLIGAAEGISYLVVIGFVAAALLSKVTSGKGLPAGPGGLLGAAEGLSFLTAVAGLAVLGFQLADYGYVPEAVPVQGGICTKQLSG